MNILLGALIVAAVTGVCVAAMLLVRRRAPEGSYFSDGDRASGVFGVLATGFSVLLGFVVFLAFTSYDQARSGAEAEARTVAQQVETAQFFRPAVAGTLSGELICYGRAVVNEEWGQTGDTVNPWGVRMFRTIRAVEPATASEQSAYDKWLDQTSDREQARQDRMHGAAGVIPTPLWIVIFFISVVIFVYMLFFADRAEMARTQALLMGSVAAVIVTMLLLLAFLDNPFQTSVGGLRPTSMERALRLADQALGAVGRGVAVPCDASGREL